MKPLTTPSRLAVVAGLAMLTATAQAQKLAPGLWENAMTMKGGNAQMEKGMAEAQAAMAKMPPEQRKMMQDMMAKQGVAMGAKPNSIQLCITPEMADRGELPQKDGHCTHKTVQRSGGTMKYSFSCEGNPPTSGEGEYTMVSDKAYNGHTVVNTVVQGKPERMEMTVSGKWLAADCGNLKPPAAKK
jgi:hypothetical protein